jgi:hypothetical protein
MPILTLNRPVFSWHWPAAHRPLPVVNGTSFRTSGSTRANCYGVNDGSLDGYAINLVGQHDPMLNATVGQHGGWK